jgi:LysM repeat protein
MRKAAALGIIFGIALLAAGLAPAAAAGDAPGPAAAISYPTQASVITGEKATVTVLFDAGSDALVNAAELYVDGALHDAIAISPAVSSGSCKLTWRCGQFAEGDHTLTARVYDSSGHSRAVDVAVTLKAAPGDRGGQRLEVTIVAPAEGQEIAGQTQVRVRTDESRVRYVMLLIDDVFVALTNMAPFTYSLDTTRYLNGRHTLKATAFDLGDSAHDSAPVNVIINNPGGRTEMRAEPAPARAPQQTTATPGIIEPQAAPEPAARAAKPALVPSAPAATSAEPAPVAGAPATTTAAASALDAADGIAAEAAGPANPTGPSLAMPRAAVQPTPPAVVAAPRLPAPAAPEPSAPAVAQVAPDAHSTAATAAPSSVVAEEPIAVASAPAMTDARGALPAQAVQVAMAPTVPVAAPAARPVAAAAVAGDLATVRVEPAAFTPARPAQALTATDQEMEVPSSAHAAASIGAPPTARPQPSKPAAQVAALPAAPQPAVVRTALPAEAALTSAGSAPATALAPEMAVGADSEPAPVQVARAPSAPVVVAATRSEHGDVILHTVSAGEQLGTISARYQVPLAEIARFNGLSASAELAVGRELRIPWASGLMLNGEPVYTDVPAASEGGISLAPLRAIVEHSGGVVHWIPARKQVRARAFAREIEVTIGSRVAVVDAAQYTLETEARLLRGRAMVPLGLFRDALGLTVTFDPGTGRIYLAAK